MPEHPSKHAFALPDEVASRRERKILWRKPFQKCKSKLQLSWKFLNGGSWVSGFWVGEGQRLIWILLPRLTYQFLIACSLNTIFPYFFRCSLQFLTVVMLWLRVSNCRNFLWCSIDHRSPIPIGMQHDVCTLCVLALQSSVILHCRAGSKVLALITYRTVPIDSSFWWGTKKWGTKKWLQSVEVEHPKHNLGCQITHIDCDKYDKLVLLPPRLDILAFWKGVNIKFQSES